MGNRGIKEMRTLICPLAASPSCESIIRNIMKAVGCPVSSFSLQMSIVTPKPVAIELSVREFSGLLGEL